MSMLDIKTRTWKFSILNGSINNWSNTGVLSNFISGSIHNIANTGILDSVNIKSKNTFSIDTVANLYIQGPW
jgi:hypothetical protein